MLDEARLDRLGLDPIRADLDAIAALRDKAAVARLMAQPWQAGVIDSGACPHLPTTVVDLTPMGKGDAPELVRQGAGDASILGL